MSDFERELTALINQHSRENESNTPDFILAMYMEACLAAFATAVQQRETWYGRDARPRSIFGPGPQDIAAAPSGRKEG